MDIFYNAFISYRHHPDDIKVAIDIHRGLERFKIPKSIKKQGKSITRLFRDKEELPITSSLTDNISLALENSDFLIVICSPHTKESIWVQREIETFLRTHSRDRVLTVLAGGEPYDVIPEILLYEDVVNPITGEVERQEIEPLSCDWRMKKRKAVREELPRLAAALLGCGYDELRQRQRQYRMRRIVALFSAALIASLCLTVYFINTSIQIQKANNDLTAANGQIRDANVQIQNNLDRALLNQSEYLASSSAERLEAGDRLTAIALALEALPGAENDRPYSPSAERALSDALNSYQAVTDVGVVGTFSADTLVTDYLIGGEGTQIFIMDARGMVTVWNTQTFEKTATIQLASQAVQNYYLTAGGNLLVTVSDNSVIRTTCYTPEGKALWEQTDCQKLAFLDERSTVMLLLSPFMEQERLVFLNAETGKRVREDYILPDLDGILMNGFCQLDYSTDLPVTLRYFKGEYQYIYLLDLADGNFRQLLAVDSSRAGEDLEIAAAAVDEDGDILALIRDGSGDMNGSYGNGLEITSAAWSELRCYDSQTLQKKWSGEIVTYMYGAGYDILPVPGKNQVLCRTGNTFRVYDGETGAVLMDCLTPSVPLIVEVEDQRVCGILRTGSYYDIAFDDAMCAVTGFSGDDIDIARWGNGYYTHTPLSNQVRVYRVVGDEEYTEFEGVERNSGDNLAWDNYLVQKTYDSISVMDTLEHKLLWQQESDSYHTLQTVSQDGRGFWMWERHNSVAKLYSFETGEVLETRELEDKFTIADAYTSQEAGEYFSADQVLGIVEADGCTRFVRVDLDTGEADLTLDIPQMVLEETDYTENTTILQATRNVAWLWQEKDRVNLLNLHTGRITPVAEGISTQPLFAWNREKTQMMVGMGHELLLTTPGGNAACRIDLGDQKAAGMYFYRGELLVLCDDAILYRFDRQGNRLSATSLQVYSGFASSLIYSADDPMGITWWETADGHLILNVFGAGNVIDTANWQVRAFIPQMRAYNQTGDQVICLANNTLVSFPLYSMEDQIARGIRTLGTFRLTEEDKKTYGID